MVARLAQQGAHLPAALQAVDEVLELLAALSDRLVVALALTPVVDRRVDDVDALGEHVQGHGDRGVLVQHALGEAQALRVPEGPAVDLVPRRAVAEQDRLLVDVGAQPGVGEDVAVHAGLDQALAAEPHHVAAGEVRAGLLEDADEQLRRVRREHVVAVHEHQVVAGDVLKAGVPRRAEAGVRLVHDLEAGVLCREPLGDVTARVLRAVVDQDDFQLVTGLRGDGLKALVEVRRHVVNGHHDAQHRTRHSSRIGVRSMRSTHTVYVSELRPMY
nr:hypothetical protein GCM10020092_010930 [Actinoplanes digitatis]